MLLAIIWFPQFAQISTNWGRVDTAAAPRRYAAGDLLAASHILFVTQNKPDSAKRNALARAQQIRARVNASNFAALATNNSEDTQSGAQGGSLGVFPRGAMVPEFQNALLSLKPGEISPIIETPYGYHIIRRPTFEEVRETFLDASRAQSMQQTLAQLLEWRVGPQVFDRLLPEQGRGDRLRTAAKLEEVEDDQRRNDRQGQEQSRQWRKQRHLSSPRFRR